MRFWLTTTGGVPTPRKCAKLLFGKMSAENCMKMKEIGGDSVHS